MKVLQREWVLSIRGIPYIITTYTIYYNISGLTSDSSVPSPDISKLDDTNNEEEKDGKYTCTSKDPPLEDTQGN